MGRPAWAGAPRDPVRGLSQFNSQGSQSVAFRPPEQIHEGIFNLLPKVFFLLNNSVFFSYKSMKKLKLGLCC
jgi:hypothetical protein